MSAIKAEVDRVGRPQQEINEEELKESLKCEMLENCTPQYCCTCQEKFSSQLNSKAHYAGKPHQKLLQIKLKIMLRKKINEENLRKKLGDSEFINSTTIATEAKQIVTAEMTGVKTSIKEETGKRTGDHLDEMCDLPSNLLEKCQPTYCDVCCIPLLNENTTRTHYEGKPHKKKLKLLEIKRSPTNYTCSLCQVTATSEVHLEIHRQGSNHKSKEAQQEALRTCSGTEEVKTEEAIISIQSMKSGSVPKKEIINGLYCDVCDVEVTAETELNAHLNGKAHKKKLDLIEKQQNPVHFTCELCQVSCNTRRVLAVHLQGSKHKSKEAQQEALRTRVGTPEVKTEQAISIQSMKSGSAPQKENMNGLYCDVCDVTGSSEMDLNKHLNGKSHKKKFDLIQKGQNQVGFICKLCKVSCTGQKTLKSHLQGQHHLAKIKNLKRFSSDRGEFTAINNQTFEMHQSFVHGHKIEPSSIENKHESQQVVSYVSSKEPPEQKNVVEIDTESLPMQVAVMMDDKMSENSVMVYEKTDETKDIPDSKDSRMSKPVGHNDTDMESMSMQTALMMNENTRGKSVIKDEKMDDGEDKDVPDLCDSMSNLAGYSDKVKNNELKITPNVKEKEVHPAEIEKSSTNKSSEEEDIIFVTENIEVNKSVNGDDEREEEASSDDDLIILENPDSLSPQKPIQNTLNLNNAPLVESVKLCVYPVGQSARVSVSTGDYATLAYDTFLNDIIIDFYLLYLANNVLSNNDREKVHIFSTMFYSRLVQSPRADAKKVPEYENDNTLTPSEIRHFRVASWTKSVDLFEKDMIIIPICEEFHWYLLLIVKPGMMFLPFKSKERKARGEPFMIVLDSMGGRNITTVKNIRRYLACEWNKKKCGGAKQLTKLEEMGRKTSILRPNKPEQENNCDCGIFLLEYVDTVFQNVSKFLWPSYVNSRSSEWFTNEEVAGKREEIAQLIKRLTKEQKPGEIIKYPNIKFTAEGIEDVKED